MTNELNTHYFNGHADRLSHIETAREPMTRDEAVEWLTDAEEGWYAQLKHLEQMREDLAGQGAGIDCRIADALRALISLNDAREGLIDVLAEKVYRVCVSMRSEHEVFVRASDEYAATEAAEYHVNRKFHAEVDGEYSYDYEVMESMLIDEDDHSDTDPHCEA